MWQATELRFAADHPTAAGHFPSNPIMPGALLLDAIVAAIAGTAGPHAGVTIRVAKFLRPVRPGEGLDLRWQSPSAGSIKFECRRLGDDDTVATGTLEFRPVPA